MCTCRSPGGPRTRLRWSRCHSQLHHSKSAGTAMMRTHRSPSTRRHHSDRSGHRPHPSMPPCKGSPPSSTGARRCRCCTRGGTCSGIRPEHREALGMSTAVVLAEGARCNMHNRIQVEPRHCGSRTVSRHARTCERTPGPCTCRRSGTGWTRTRRCSLRALLARRVLVAPTHVHAYEKTKSVHVAPFWHGPLEHSSWSTEQSWLPGELPQPFGQAHTYASTESVQVPPWAHGTDAHSSKSTWHSVPVHPSTQAQKNAS